MGSSGSQLVPAGADAARFAADRTRLLAALEQAGLDVKLYASAFNPYPFRITDTALAELEALQQSVQRALTALVPARSSDPRVAAVITLEPEEEQLLALVNGRPYRPGAFRPDFLHAADGRAMVTEINGRFPINGFLSSSILNSIIPQLDTQLAPLPGLTRLEDQLAARLGEGGTVGILRATEPGWDIHVFQARWPSRYEVVAPALLTVEKLSSWTGILVELHQHELLKEVPAAALAALVAHPGILNDVRTILVGHDKRLLSLLSTSSVLEDYVETADVQRLRRHVVPTWVKGRSPDIVQQAKDRPSGWLAKPPRSGKGRGILVSHQMEPDRWREALRTLPEDWILQPYVDQCSFPITILADGAVETHEMKVVGLLPALDDHAFGPGMYRASADDVVNVARGGTILAPALSRGSCR